MNDLINTDDEMKCWLYKKNIDWLQNGVKYRRGER